jgi:hypothetical protein
MLTRLNQPVPILGALVCLLAWYPSPTTAQDPTALARALADPRSSAGAIESVVASPKESLPLLLRWSRKPPPGLSIPTLHGSMIEIFGRLKTVEAAPFLIEHIEYGSVMGNLWMKQSDVVVERLPAVRALIRIGPAALSDLQAAYLKAAGTKRLAIVLAMARMKDGRARASLDFARAMASAEMQITDEGLRSLNVKERR